MPKTVAHKINKLKLVVFINLFVFCFFAPMTLILGFIKRFLLEKLCGVT